MERTTASAAASKRGYVLAVTSRQRLGFIPVTRWLAKVSPEGWQRLSAGDGAKGPRLYDWAYLSQRRCPGLVSGPADPTQPNQARGRRLLSGARARRQHACPAG